MKLLLITESPYYGGTDTYTLNLYKFYNSENVNCKIIINDESKAKKRYMREVNSNDLYFIRNGTSVDPKKISIKFFKQLINLIKIPLNLFKILRIIKSQNIDHLIVISGSWPGGYLTISAILLSPFLRINVINTIHNYPIISIKTQILSLIYLFCTKIGKSPALITVSEDCKSQLKPFFKKIEMNVVPNAIPDFANTKGNSIFIKTNLVFVGNIEPRKGLHILLGAMQILRKKSKFDYELFVYGRFVDSNYKNKVIEMAKNLSVHWCGFENNKEIIYNSKGLLILPSTEFESFGLVIIEAMCASVPVLVTNDLGMKEVIENSYLDTEISTFKNGSIDDLSNKIDFIMSSYDSLQLRNKSRSSFIDTYEFGEMQKNLNKYFGKEL